MCASASSGLYKVSKNSDSSFTINDTLISVSNIFITTSQTLRRNSSIHITTPDHDLTSPEHHRNECGMRKWVSDIRIFLFFQIFSFLLVTLTCISQQMMNVLCNLKDFLLQITKDHLDFLFVLTFVVNIFFILKMKILLFTFLAATEERLHLNLVFMTK